MEVQTQQEMQEPIVQQARLQLVSLALLMVMQVVHLEASLLMLVLGEQLRLALKGHLEVAVEEHLRVARIVEVATLELAAHSPWMQPLPQTPDSPLWCLHL